ncbi:hypothetical protein [uncultured Bacteroides sp.]|uniref:hypothetical protein n=1 Tax=uncultured Bacteroides sp. TaxID=162156 RepID=UPI00262F21DF|nr:hypothetical protein [uncultured Bacteroides sp.]
MKTIIRKFQYIVAVLIATFTLSSCDGFEVGIGWGPDCDGYYEATDILCSRTWSDSWYNDYEGLRYYQELRFYYDNTGTDYLEVTDRYGNRRTSVLNFYWDWTGYDRICMDYGDGRSYLDHISFNGWSMDCKFDGEWVTFDGR